MPVASSRVQTQSRTKAHGSPLTPYAAAAFRCSSASRAAARTASGWSGPSTRPVPAPVGASGGITRGGELFYGVHQRHEDRVHVEGQNHFLLAVVGELRPHRPDALGEDGAHLLRVEA